MSSNLLNGIAPRLYTGAMNDGVITSSVLPNIWYDVAFLDLPTSMQQALAKNQTMHLGISAKWHDAAATTGTAWISVAYENAAGNQNSVNAFIPINDITTEWKRFSSSVVVPSGMHIVNFHFSADCLDAAYDATNPVLSYDSPIVLAVSEITAADVNDGIGIKSITPQYYLSTSNSAQADGSWSDKEPAYKSGKYYWTRSKIVWDDGTTTYTAAVLAEGVNNANSSAQNANEAASIAQNTASKAQSAANSAASAASKAQSSANQAQATADAAITSSTTAVASTVVQYIQTADQTTPADDASGWSENTVQYDSNKYIWMRVIYKLKDGTTTVGKPVALTAGVQRDLNSMKQAFWADSTGAHVKSGNGGETVVKGDGVHINVNGNEVANYTASGGEITQLTVDSYLYSGAHRIEMTTMFGEKGTGFFWKG